MGEIRDRAANIKVGNGHQADSRSERGGHRGPPLQGMRYAVTALVLLGAVGVVSFALRFVAANPSSSGPTFDKLGGLPKIVLWAWERPEDLSFIDPREIGVAFLAKTIYLQGERAESRPRLQPLTVPAAAALVAVVRIESGGAQSAVPEKPDLVHEVAEQIAELAHRPRKISAIQIDFDARKSEREFYRMLLAELRKQLPPEMPLSITALASWCIYDDWIGDLPVDEAVPMLFRMGVDDRQVRLHLETGGDFKPGISRGSLGVSTDEPLDVLPSGKRVYVFSPKKWSEDDVREITRRYGAPS